jgi:PAS domain S-box-containing protein
MTKEINQLVKKAKELEKELKDTKEYLKAVFDFAPDAYFLNDLKGNFIDGNKAAEELIGYKREELIGRNMLELKLLPLEQIPKAAKRLAVHALGKKTEPGEFTLIRKDGRRISVEISGAPVKIKNRTIVVGIAHDITERKHFEQELKKKNEELERFNQLAVGREMRMIELKNKIRELEKKQDKK